MGTIAFDEHGVEPVLLQQLHGPACRCDQAVVLTSTEPKQAQAALRGGIVERGAVLTLPRFCERRRVCGTGAAAAADNAGTEHADVRELVQVRNADVQRLVAAHRQAGNSPARAIHDHAIVLLDIRHQVGDEVRHKRIRSAADAGIAGSGRLGNGPADRGAGAIHVARGHHHNHRPRFFRRDEIVEDEARTADGAPGVVNVAGAVQ